MAFASWVDLHCGWLALGAAVAGASAFLVARHWNRWRRRRCCPACRRPAAPSTDGAGSSCPHCRAQAAPTWLWHRGFGCVGLVLLAWALGLGVGLPWHYRTTRLGETWDEGLTPTSWLIARFAHLDADQRQRLMDRTSLSNRQPLEVSQKASGLEGFLSDMQVGGAFEFSGEWLTSRAHGNTVVLDLSRLPGWQRRCLTFQARGALMGPSRDFDRDALATWILQQNGTAVPMAPWRHWATDDEIKRLVAVGVACPQLPDAEAVAVIQAAEQKGLPWLEGEPAPLDWRCIAERRLPDPSTLRMDDAERAHRWLGLLEGGYLENPAGFSAARTPAEAADDSPFTADAKQTEALCDALAQAGLLERAGRAYANYLKHPLGDSWSGQPQMLAYPQRLMGTWPDALLVDCVVDEVVWNALHPDGRMYMDDPTAEFARRLALHPELRTALRTALEAAGPRLLEDATPGPGGAR